MKKLRIFITFIAIIILIFIIFYFLPKNYKVKYKVSKYNVYQTYNKKTNVYTFNITNGKNKYVYALENKFKTRYYQIKKVSIKDGILYVDTFDLGNFYIIKNDDKYYFKNYDSQYDANKIKTYKNIDIYNNNNIAINTHTAGAREDVPETVENSTQEGGVPLPEEKNDRAEAATILCGPNKNVKLTPAQLEELENRIPNQITRYIHRLSRYKVGRANAAMMDDYQWLLGWISEDHADRKERELEAIRQAEAEEDRRELEELQNKILKRKGRADLCE